jgi:hypothetical protein
MHAVTTVSHRYFHWVSAASRRILYAVDIQLRGQSADASSEPGSFHGQKQSSPDDNATGRSRDALWPAQDVHVMRHSHGTEEWQKE